MQDIKSSKSLLILAYNEEETIISEVEQYIELFEVIIIVNDCSKDRTKILVEDYINKNNVTNIKLINNKKNVGAGKSFQTGVDYFLKSNSQFLIKIDGDGQFEYEDVKKLKEIQTKLEPDYIKGDRFWESGVIGEIPLIRYIGNTFASLLIKLSTGNWQINDPLNGLMAFSRYSVENLNIPKIFYRYGYPFYVCIFISKLSYVANLQIIQYKNTIKYGDQKSNLKPLIMFFKLITFTIFSFFTKIKLKFLNSRLQMSALLDFVFTTLFVLFIYSLVTFVKIRYFLFRGDEANWFVVMIIFLLISVFTFVSSQKSENLVHSEKFTDYQ